MLIALDGASITEHLEELESGVVIVDLDNIKVDVEDPALFHVPLKKMALEKGGDTLFSNTVAMGVAIGLLCYDIAILEKVLTEKFEKKGESVVKKNIESAKAGFEYAQSQYPGKCHYVLRPQKKVPGRMLITGNEAVGLGALASGLKFLSAYPMTPSTGVMNYVAANSEGLGVIVEQVEDEISALNMAIGASFAGVRSMTTTSGGGFSLMVEALGLSGMTETPVVIFLCQRPGPATGLPTMTEQGDLEFVLHAAQGEFPRCILAPKSAEDAFYLTSKAFNIADKYQIPVFILSDQYLADSVFVCKKMDSSKIRIERNLLSDDEVERETYLRYRFTDAGISERALPGQNGALVVADSDEHNEAGHIDESIENRVKMSDKRLKKLELLKNTISLPEVFGDENADISLIGWGSTYGPISEAVSILNEKGVSINLIHFNEIYPLPEKKIKALLSKSNKTVCIEQNASGQFARVLRAYTGVSVNNHILKYDGRPFTPDKIIEELKLLKVV